MATFQVNFFAQTLGRTVPLYVILPTDKSFFSDMEKREEKPFKTLYLLHGITGNYTDWLHGTGILRYAEERNLAVVMPSADNAFYVDQPWNCNMYGEFIGKELVEFTRKTFPLSAEREDTFIGGLSMGGYGALRNGLKYHDTFGGIVALSSALIINETLLQKAENPMFPFETEEYKHSCFGPDLKIALEGDLNPKQLVRKLREEKKAFPMVYMACGTEDFLMDVNQDFSDYLNAHDVPHTFETGSGGHEWAFWDKYIQRALDVLPLEDKAAGFNSGNIRK